MDPTTAVTALHADNFREGEHIRINPGHYGTYETIFIWQNREIFMLTKKEEGHQWGDVFSNIFDLIKDIWTMTSSYTELCSSSESTTTRDINCDNAFKVLKLFNLTHQRLERTALSILFFSKKALSSWWDRLELGTWFRKFLSEEWWLSDFWFWLYNNSICVIMESIFSNCCLLIFQNSATWGHNN